MEGLPTIRQEKFAHATFCTTLLACLWGAEAAYILSYSLFITHNMHLGLTALVPLVAVWATLERKRWGRLALMGLSLTTIGFFLVAVTVLIFLPNPTQTVEMQSLTHLLYSLEATYNIGMPVVLGILLLAAFTGPWLCHPLVVAEFDQRKQRSMANAQRAIATVLVGCWGAAIALHPLLAIDRDTGNLGRYSLDAGPRSRGAHLSRHHGSHNLSSRPSRSAPRFNRP